MRFQRSGQVQLAACACSGIDGGKVFGHRGIHFQTGSAAAQVDGHCTADRLDVLHFIGIFYGDRIVAVSGRDTDIVPAVAGVDIDLICLLAGFNCCSCIGADIGIHGILAVACFYGGCACTVLQIGGYCVIAVAGVHIGHSVIGGDIHFVCVCAGIDLHAGSAFEGCDRHIILTAVGIQCGFTLFAQFYVQSVLFFGALIRELGFFHDDLLAKSHGYAAKEYVHALDVHVAVDGGLACAAAFNCFSFFVQGVLGYQLQLEVVGHFLVVSLFDGNIAFIGGVLCQNDLHLAAEG